MAEEQPVAAGRTSRVPAEEWQGGRAAQIADAWLTTDIAADSALSQQIRQIILEQSKRAHVGHIGSALSIADIVAVLYGTVLDIPDPADPDRDRFVLSKAHAALALYAALHLKGWITTEDLNTCCGDESLLGVHAEQALRGVDF